MTENISRRRSKGKIPKTIGDTRVKIGVVGNRRVGSSIVLSVIVNLNGLEFNRSYMLPKSLNQNEMIDFVTAKIKEEQTTINVPVFEVTL